MREARIARFISKVPQDVRRDSEFCLACPGCGPSAAGNHLARFKPLAASL